MGASALALAAAIVVATAAASSGQTVLEDSSLRFSPYLMTSPTLAGSGDEALIHGFSRKIAPRWKASYGLGAVEETDLTSSYLRYDQTRAFGTRTDRGSSENFRHFLGVEYAPFKHVSMLAGVAKASGNKGGFSPTGYDEKIRFNAGMRFMVGEWGIDGGFAYIPFGPSRLPSDAAYVPGLGGSPAAYFLSLSFTRKF